MLFSGFVALTAGVSNRRRTGRARLLGNFLILLLGFAWLAATTLLVKGTLNLPALLLASVVPFIRGDLLKIGIATLVLPGGWALPGPNRSER